MHLYFKCPKEGRGVSLDIYVLFLQEFTYRWGGVLLCMSSKHPASLLQIRAVRQVLTQGSQSL